MDIVTAALVILMALTLAGAYWIGYLEGSKRTALECVDLIMAYVADESDEDMTTPIAMGAMEWLEDQNGNG